MNENVANAANAAPRRPTDLLSVGALVALLLWVSGCALCSQLAALTAATEPGTFFERPDITASQIFFGAAILEGLALLLALLPFALWWRAPRYRAAFRAWVGAALFVLLLAPARLFSGATPQLLLSAQSMFALLFALFLWLTTGRGNPLTRAASNAVALAVGAGIFLALPWLAWGALGSATDVALGILNALAFALAATLLLARVWLRGMARDSRGVGWDITLGGFVTGALLLMMGSAIGFNGTQLWFMLSLAALGWLAMALVYTNFQIARRWNEPALLALCAIVAAAPMLFLDPKAGVLVAALGDGEVLVYVMGATAWMVWGAWALGALCFFLRNRLGVWESARFAWLGASAAAAIGLLIYFGIGQPGLYGDQVFVILKNQADVTAVKNSVTYGERRALAYQTLTAHAAQTQAPLRATLDGFAIPYTPYYLVNALQVDADYWLVWLLTRDAAIDRILPAPTMRPLPAKPGLARGEATSAPTEPAWNLTLIGADRVWKDFNARGQGIVVGQADSGVDGAHPELAAQYRGRDGNNAYNWLDPWYHTLNPTDIGGHGTHTLGSILGKHVGVAPEAEWIGCVNLARNLANPGLYLTCMQFLFAPYPQNGDALRDGDATRGAMVLNNSWGCPETEGCDANALLPAVRALREAGVFVVASAGNDGPGCSSVQNPIALYDDVFSVGAVNRNRRIADFSSRGPVLADGSGRIKPDIAAPGVAVYSSMPDGTYAENSGTSMAGPHVVGVVALIWSANPKLIGDIDATKEILRATAQPRAFTADGDTLVCGDPNAIPNDFFGYGIVDAYAAVQRALGK